MPVRSVVVAVVLAACGDQAAAPPAVRFALPATGVPQPLAVPFPSDVYKGATAAELSDWSFAGIDEPEPAAMLSNYSVLDGFGEQSGVVFSLENLALADQIDPDTLANTSVFVDLDANNAIIPSTVGWDAFAKAIVAVPTDALTSGHRYAAALLAGPKLVTGTALAPSPGFSATGIYKDAIDALVAAGVARDTILVATLYTTSTGHMHAVDTATRLFAGAYGAAPQLVTDNVVAPFRSTKFGRTAHAGWTATLDEWLGATLKDSANHDVAGAAGTNGGHYGYPHDAVAAIVTGTFNSPQFPRDFAGTADPADGTTLIDSDGNSVPAQPDAQIPVVVVIPTGTAPAAGWPVAIFQHGLGGDRSTALTIMNELARAGIATVAIDAPAHGMRDPLATDTKSLGIGTYQGPDGFADSANPLVLLQVVGRVRNTLRMRDVVWQFAFDLVQTRRLIDAIDLSSISDEFAAVPKLDATHVGVIGWSLGGLATTLFAGVADGTHVDPVVIVSPASNIAELFAGSPVYAAQSTLLSAAANVHPASLDPGRYSVLLQLLEGTLGPTDTGAFAPLVAAHHDVWLEIAGEDESVPHTSSDQLARALGATQLTPALRTATGVAQGSSQLSGAHIAAYFEVAPGNHSHAFERNNTFTYEPPYPRDGDERFVQLPSTVPVRQTPVAEQRAIATFLTSHFAGAPVVDVSDPMLAPIADFDDDGYCDADEVAAGTNPYDPTSKPTGTPNCTRNVGF